MKTYLPRKRAECQLIENLKDLCRLCLNECVNGVPIYPDSDSEAQPLLATKIMMCVGIEVPRDDELSNQVCLHCIGEINSIYSFRKVCEIAHQRIKRHIHACQQIKYRLKAHHIDIFTKQLNKNLESNEESDKGNVNSSQNVTDNGIVSHQNIENLHAIHEETIEHVQNVTQSCQQQNAASHESESAEYLQNTYLDENVGKLQIVEVNHDLESDKNIGGFEITEPILETHQNNELNQNNTNLENVSHVDQIINNINAHNGIAVIENNILAPTAENLPDNRNSISEANYSIQVFMAGQSEQTNNELNRIYYIKAKEAVESANVIECAENVAAVSTSSLNSQTESHINSNQKVEKNNLTEVISEFILSRLRESGIVKMEGDAIATCDIGTICLETSNGDIVEMEIVEEEPCEKRKYKMTTRKKKPECAQSCGECGLVVRSAASLRRHALRHAGAAARAHTCPHCARAFTLPSALRRHQLTHLAVRQFACAQCGASFSQRGALAAHVRARHDAALHGAALHSCRACAATYMHSSGLTRHVKKHHLGQKAQCGDCSKTLADASSLKRHRGTCPKAQASPLLDTKLLDTESVGEPDMGPNSLAKKTDLGTLKVYKLVN